MTSGFTRGLSGGSSAWPVMRVAAACGASAAAETEAETTTIVATMAVTISRLRKPDPRPPA
jgi:hypothetical protein